MAVELIIDADDDACSYMAQKYGREKFSAH